MPERNELPRRCCLKSRLEISHLFKAGKRFSGAYFSLVWQENDSFKYGVFVSRRFGNAARRNRIKRVFREAIRLNRKLLERPVKIAVLPNRVSDKQKFELIDAEISRLFRGVNNQA
ncbi:MAG: ribonuclease P protein component [candidate division Zixibacteria bacterium]|nr:ribonuclease P protein component [candidate division Zixibacteria bacterium]